MATIRWASQLNEDRAQDKVRETRRVNIKREKLRHIIIIIIIVVVVVCTAIIAV